jgi:hypothetical protein
LSDPDIDAGEIQAQLERILASPGFARADSLGRFLRFAVEQTQAGRTDRLKELEIGCEVFRRGTDFDPRVDPIVRVQAREVRARLAAYYAEDAHSGEAVIELPNGDLQACRGCGPTR